MLQREAIAQVPATFSAPAQDVFILIIKGLSIASPRGALQSNYDPRRYQAYGTVKASEARMPDPAKPSTLWASLGDFQITVFSHPFFPLRCINGRSSP
jgi:hypothetical protein